MQGDQGKPGDRGKKGEQGDAGAPGSPGPSVTAFSVCYQKGCSSFIHQDIKLVSRQEFRPELSHFVFSELVLFPSCFTASGVRAGQQFKVKFPSHRERLERREGQDSR